MNRIFTFIFSLLIGSLFGQITYSEISPFSAEASIDYQSGIEARKSLILNAKAISIANGNAGVDDGKKGFNHLLAKIKSDPSQKTVLIAGKGKDLVNSTWVGSLCSPFSSPGLAAYYFEFKDELPQDQKDKIFSRLNSIQSFPYRCPSGTKTGWDLLMREDQVLDPVYSPDNPNAGKNGTENGKGSYKDSENFRWMNMAAGYLFAHDEFLNKTTDPNHQVRKDHFDKVVKNWIKMLYHTGRVEWNSNNYWGHTFGPLLVLYEYAQDSTVKEMVKAGLDWMVLEMALHYNDGFKGGADVRAKPTFMERFAGSFWGYGYYYFADASHLPSYSTSEFANHSLSDYLGYAQYSSYVPPQAIIDIAHKEFDLPVTIQSAKPFYQISFEEYSYWQGNQSKGRKYEFETIYLDKNMVLSSAASNTPGAYLSCSWGNFAEQSMWSMTVKGTSKGANFIFGNSGANTKSKWTFSTGRNPHEEIAQVDQTMLRLVKNTDKISFHLPQDAIVEITNGKGYFDLGNGVYAAVIPFNHTDTSKTASFSSEHTSYNWLFSANNSLSACVFETGTSREYASFSAFKAAVTNKTITSSKADQISYTNTNGKKIDVTYNPLRKDTLRFYNDSCMLSEAGVTPTVYVNGVEKKYENWESYKVVNGQRIIEQKWGSGRMEVASNDHGLRIDVSPTTSEVKYYAFKDKSVVSIDDPIDINSTSTFYPNPFTNQISVASKSTIKEIKITELSGSIAINKDANANKVVVNTSLLPNGIYILQVLTENGIEVYKVIK